MRKNNFKFSLLALAVVSVISFTGIDQAFAEVTDEDLAKVKELARTGMQLKIQNQNLEKLSSIDGMDAIRENNEKALDAIMNQIEILIPPVPQVHIEPDMKAKMDIAHEKIFQSDIPWTHIGIQSETGKLLVVVDKTKATDVNSLIEKLTDKGVPLDIRYEVPQAQLQAACGSGVEAYCNPLVGGGYVTDDAFGSDCTIGMGVVRNVPWPGSGTQTGIIIPDHCNKGTYMMQNTWNDTNERVGDQTDDGGAWCDCDFIESDQGRSVSTTIINDEGSDFTIAGKADAGDENWVWMNGGQTGWDLGLIKEVNQSHTFFGNEFSNLYQIQYINFVNGDSGAPIVDYTDDKYAGFNIGADVISGTSYNFGHDWTFLKDRMELQ